MTMATTGSTFDDVGGTEFGNAGASESAFGMDKGVGGLGEKMRNKSASLRDQASDKLHSVIDDGKEQVASTLDGLVTAAREISDRLQDGSYGPIGGYAQTAADTLEGWVRTVREKSVDELLDDGRELVRTQPAIAIGIAVAAGFALTRFLKAGSGRSF